MRVEPLPRERVDAHVAEVERRVDKVLSHVLTGVLTHLKSVSQFGVDDLTMLTTAWRQQVTDVLMPLIVDVYGEGARGVFDQVHAVVAAASDQSGDNTDVSAGFTVSASLAEYYFAAATSRLTRVSDTVWDEARSQLTEGVQRGESITQLTDRISGVHGIAEGRAKVIARTEVLTAARGGAYDEVSTLGMTGTHEWLAVNDTRTRETHAQADGQVVALDQPFAVGGYSLRFPGDPNAPASETIQCRCDTAYELD